MESALVEHEAVAEAAVVGRPHPVKGESLYCFVTLNDGISYNQKLEGELKKQGMCAWFQTNLNVRRVLIENNLHKPILKYQCDCLKMHTVMFSVKNASKYPNLRPSPGSLANP